MQCVVYIVQCAVFSVKCTVHSMQCVVCRQYSGLCIMAGGTTLIEPVYCTVSLLRIEELNKERADLLVYSPNLVRV